MHLEDDRKGEVGRVALHLKRAVNHCLIKIEHLVSFQGEIWQAKVGPLYDGLWKESARRLGRAGRARRGPENARAWGADGQPAAAGERAPVPGACRGAAEEAGRRRDTDHPAREYGVESEGSVASLLHPCSLQELNLSSLDWAQEGTAVLAHLWIGIQFFKGLSRVRLQTAPRS